MFARNALDDGFVLVVGTAHLRPPALRPGDLLSPASSLFDMALIQSSNTAKLGLILSCTRRRPASIDSSAGLPDRWVTNTTLTLSSVLNSLVTNCFITLLTGSSTP